MYARKSGRSSWSGGETSVVIALGTWWMVWVSGWVRRDTKPHLKLCPITYITRSTPKPSRLTPKPSRFYSLLGTPTLVLVRTCTVTTGINEIVWASRTEESTHHHYITQSPDVPHFLVKQVQSYQPPLLITLHSLLYSSTANAYGHQVGGTGNLTVFCMRGQHMQK